MLNEQDEEIDFSCILINEAAKYAKDYEGDDKTDVLNAFFHEAEYQIKESRKQIIVDKLRPMSEAKEEGLEYFVIRKDCDKLRFIAVEYLKLMDGIACWYADDGERFLESQLIGNIKAPIYKPKKAEAFHQKDVPGRLRGISGVDEARDLGESAAKCMTELMQTKEGG